MTIPIFLIGLKRAIGRAALMEQELRQAGLSATRIDAVDCDDVGRDVMLHDCRAEGPWGYFQTKDMACTLSHAKAWEAFLKTNAKVALILEDDVFLSPELGGWLSDLSWWPDDAGLVRFESWRSPRLRVAIARLPQQYNGRRIGRMLSRNPGGAAYAISRDAAQLFLAQKPFDITLDNLLFNTSASRAARQIAIYQVQPAMAEQGNEAPGEVLMGPPRHRPTGLPLLRQKIRRGICEIRGGLGTIINLALGRATLERIRFEPTVLAGSDLPQTHTA